MHPSCHFLPCTFVIAAALFGVAAGQTSGQPARAPDDRPVLAPAKDGLLPVTLPSLDRLEGAVAKQIGSFQQWFVGLVAQGAMAEGELAEAYGTLGQLYQVYELSDAAETCYLNARKLTPKDYRWPHLLAHLYDQTGQPARSVPLYEEVRKLEPGYAAAAVRLGEVHLQLAHPDDARAQFQAALKLDPNLAAAHSGLGAAALAERAYAEAVEHFETALKQVPAATRLHYCLGMAYRGLGDLDEARRHLQQRGTVGVRPPDPLVDGLKALVTGERVHMIRGQLAFNAGRYREAAEAFALAVEAKPDSTRARVNLGTSLGKTGDVSGAVEQFQNVLRLDPDNLTAHFNLATLQLRDGQFEEARRHFREVLRIHPDDAEANHELAKLLIKAGRTDQALDLLLRSARLRPADEDCLLDLAALLIGQGRHQEARQRLEQAHRRFPDRGLTAHALARLLATCPDASLRDGPRALDLAQKVYRAQKTLTHAETLALCLAEVGRCADAAVLQRQLIDAAKKAGHQPLAARFKKDLLRYEAGSPCRPPVQAAATGATESEARDRQE